MSEAPPPRLSARQRECLEGVAAHLDSHQIAEQLGVSPHTVDGHIAAAIAALGARSRRDAVRLYLAQTPTGKRLTGQFPLIEPTAGADQEMPLPNAVRDEALPFGDALIAPLPRQNEGNARHDTVTSSLRTLVLVVGLAAAMIIVILAIPPLVQTARDLANAIQPSKPH